MNPPGAPRVQWALTLPPGALAAAAALRLHAIAICASNEELWLRGTERLEEIQPKLAALSGAKLFRVAADGVATPAGARVPTARLPDGPWQPLAEAINIAAPVAALPGTVADKVALRLVRDDRVREANVLVANAETWRDFAPAPAVRLRTLKFALSRNLALIWGRPVPAIAGVQCVESDGIAVPAGLALHPTSDPGILRPLLGLSSGDLALFFDDGAWELIESGLFLPATRSAVRQSFNTSGSDAT